MALRYTRLAHVALRCKCYDAMYDFYVNRLGGCVLFQLNWDCLPEGRGNDSVWLTYIRFGRDHFLELFSEGYEGDNAPGSHSFKSLCLQVGNMANALASFEAMGVPAHLAPNGPRMTVPFSKYAPDECGNLCAYLCDPDGNWIELQQFTAGSMQIICG